MDTLAIALVQAAKIRQGEYAAYFLDLILLQRVPNAIAYEKENRFRVVDDMMYVIRIEVLQDRYDNRAICYNRHIHHAPVGGVLTDQGDLIAAAYLAFLKQDMDTGYLLRYVAKGKAGTFTIIRQGGSGPILAETLLVDLNEIFLYHSTNLSSLRESTNKPSDFQARKETAPMPIRSGSRGGFQIQRLE